MQKLDHATLREMELRDSFLRPIMRPAGIIHEYILGPALSYPVWALTRALILPFTRNKKIIDSLRPQFLQREIFTLANVVTLYGFFLWIQLVIVVLGWWQGADTVVIHSVGSWILHLRQPDALAAVITLIEILLTDLFDGPLARVNDSVTALGTLMDHVRDYLTAFTALFLLVALTIRAGQLRILFLEGVAIGLFMIVLSYHVWLMRICARSWPKERYAGLQSWIKNKIAFTREFAMEEYQTPLRARVQMGALSTAMGFGLFYYALGGGVLFGFFMTALAASILLTSYNLKKTRDNFLVRRRVRQNMPSLAMPAEDEDVDIIPTEELAFVPNRDERN